MADCRVDVDYGFDQPFDYLIGGLQVPFLRSTYWKYQITGHCYVGYLWLDTYKRKIGDLRILWVNHRNPSKNIGLGNLILAALITLLSLPEIMHVLSYSFG